MSAEDRLIAKLAELKLQLPPAPEPKGVYKPLIIVGNWSTPRDICLSIRVGNWFKDESGLILDVPPVMPLPGLPGWAFWPR